MSLLDFGRAGLQPFRRDPQTLVEKYQYVRQISREINNAIVGTLSRETFERGAAALGLFRKGRIELPGSSFADTLLDYCIYHVRENELTPLERFLDDFLPTAGAEEKRCLEAMQASVYSLYAVASVVRGVGVNLQDLFSDESHFVTDIGLSHSADSGTMLASRLIHYDEIIFTGGAAIPLGQALSDEDRDEFAHGMSKALQFGDRGVIDPAPVLRAALARLEPVESDLPQRMAFVGKKSLSSPGFIPRPRTPRNAPCPCGSGRKYKNCCADRDE